MTAFGPLAKTIFEHKYRFNDTETWEQCVERVVNNVMGAYPGTLHTNVVRDLTQIITERKFIPAGRYLYAAGRHFHQTQNCLCMGVEDSREGWSDLLRKSSMALMTGAGIGVEYSKVRPEGSVIKQTGGVASGPISLMQMLNECARHIQQGGSRRSAILAQLSWKHRDINQFIHIKDWSEEVKEMKAKNVNFPAPLDMTNISVRLGPEFFSRLNTNDDYANTILNDLVGQMCKTGEPGITINVGEDKTSIYLNACSEFRSEVPDNVCNLGSINLANISNPLEMTKVVQLATLFLYCGSYYSNTPYEEVNKVRDDTRQLGLGLMGVHEWFLKKGSRYGEVDAEFEELMSIYSNNLKTLEPFIIHNPPLKGRAIAPTGTTSILAETTSGIEPIFSVSYKRRYLKHNAWHYMYVVDPVARRLIRSGFCNEADVEDAYSIDFERRISFQAYMQKFVDMAISSTVNLPTWGSEGNNEKTVPEFKRVLLKYLDKLRGITCYPNGSRGGQPLTPVKYSTATKYSGVEMVEEAGNVCSIRGGSCGD